MRRWEVAFFGRPGQTIFWTAVILLGVLLLGVGAQRARWWWPFERSGGRVAVTPATSSPPPTGWTEVAKTSMPAVVNVASARTVRGPEGTPSPFFSDPFFRFFRNPQPAPRREQSLRSGV